MEDIDQARARAVWETQAYDDLAWFGLRWEMPVMRQSDRQPAYDDALDLLWGAGLLYPCTCTRRDIRDALDAPQEGAPHGPDGVIYPGTCRPKTPPTGGRPRETALRLDMARAAARLATKGFGSIGFSETGPVGSFATGAALPDLADLLGDIVLARRDMGTSYHLSVVVDDAAQGITLVTRGADLGAATLIHVLLQRLLGLPTPVYHHHRLIRDDAGKRLAKRDDARAIAADRAEGRSPSDLRTLLSLPPAP
jgi:glutamyl-Q tRNA(Asp) synthetase